MTERRPVAEPRRRARRELPRAPEQAPRSTPRRVSAPPPRRGDRIRQPPRPRNTRPTAPPRRAPRRTSSWTDRPPPRRGCRAPCRPARASGLSSPFVTATTVGRGRRRPQPLGQPHDLGAPPGLADRDEQARRPEHAPAEMQQLRGIDLERRHARAGQDGHGRVAGVVRAPHPGEDDRPFLPGAPRAAAAP